MSKFKRYGNDQFLLHPMTSIPRAAVIGWPIEHSLSPRLHSYWLKVYGIEGSYERIPVAENDLDHFMDQLRKSDLRGLNITVPYKQAMLRYADHLDPLAKRVGAINTLVREPDGAFRGLNTDVFGFSENVRAAGYSTKDRPAIVLGAGGAARAVVAGLQDMGVQEIRLLNRSRERALEVAGNFGSIVKLFEWSEAAYAVSDAALLINATSLGMIGRPPLEFSLEGLPKDAYVTDLIYTPLKTDLLREAEHRGFTTIDGLGMLLHQARPAFHAFFGVDPEVTPELRSFMLEVL